MAWTPPSAADFKARFPAFDAVVSAVADEAIAEAGLYVDHTWISEADYRLGLMLMAAHTLTLDGHGTGAEAEMARAGTLGFTTMKSADLTLTRQGSRSDKQGDGAGDPFALTTYGVRFVQLRQRNVPGVLSV